MFAVTRVYNGGGANALFNLLEERQDEVKEIISGVTGLVSYTMFKTENGGVSLTVCKDQAGIDESVKLAKEWIVKNGGGLSVDPPDIEAGEVFVKIS